MLRGSGALWDLRKSSPYEVYPEIEFAIPQGAQGDCYDRYLVRIEELRTSVEIVGYCLNAITSGEVKAVNLKSAPSKNTMKGFMESTIQHFK
jgi:NADH:ubiquinone oxidoreductase subunit D